MTDAYNEVLKRLKKPEKMRCGCLISGKQGDWVREQFKRMETQEEYFKVRYMGQWPERMIMDPIDEIIKYVDMNIVAMESKETTGLRNFLETHFLISEGIKEK